MLICWFALIFIFFPASSKSLPIKLEPGYAPTDYDEGGGGARDKGEKGLLKNETISERPAVEEGPHSPKPQPVDLVEHKSELDTDNKLPSGDEKDKKPPFVDGISDGKEEMPAATETPNPPTEATVSDKAEHLVIIVPLENNHRQRQQNPVASPSDPQSDLVVENNGDGIQRGEPSSIESSSSSVEENVDEFPPQQHSQQLIAQHQIPRQTQKDSAAPPVDSPLKPQQKPPSETLTSNLETPKEVLMPSAAELEEIEQQIKPVKTPNERNQKVLLKITHQNLPQQNSPAQVVTTPMPLTTTESTTSEITSTKTTSTSPDYLTLNNTASQEKEDKFNTEGGYSSHTLENKKDSSVLLPQPLREKGVLPRKSLNTSITTNGDYPITSLKHLPTVEKNGSFIGGDLESSIKVTKSGGENENAFTNTSEAAKGVMSEKQNASPIEGSNGTTITTSLDKIDNNNSPPLKPLSKNGRNEKEISPTVTSSSPDPVQAENEQKEVKFGESSIQKLEGDQASSYDVISGENEGEEGDEEEKERTIWERIIQGIRCAGQDCRGAIKDGFLIHLDDEETARRIIAETSWSIMRRARLAAHHQQ